MAEYFGATLYVPKHLITPEIAAMIKDYRENFPDTEEREGNGISALFSPEASWGQFDDIEEALVKAGIPFDRETSNYDSDPSYTTYFRPGITPEPKDVHDAIDVQAIKGLIKLGDLEALQKMMAEDYPDFPPLQGKKESEAA